MAEGATVADGAFGLCGHSLRVACRCASSGSKDDRWAKGDSVIAALQQSDKSLARLWEDVSLPHKTDQTCTSETCEAALRRICTEACRDLDEAVVIFQNSDDARGPHKARVALRRLTTCLDAFSSLMRNRSWSAYRAEAKVLFRELGKVRDSDVYLSARVGLAGHDARLRRNGRLRETVRASLRRKKAVSFSARLVSALQPKGGLLRNSPTGKRLRNGPITGLASAILVQQWDDCRAFGALVAEVPKPQRHDFRKTVKSARYLVEFFADQLSSPTGDAFRSDLRELQDVLGVLNDFDVILGIEGRKPPKTLPLREATAMIRAEALWTRLLQTPPPWGGQPTRAP